MSRRTWFNDATFTTQGLVVAAFSFVTNNTDDPDVADFRGCGGLAGVDAAGTGVSNSGPSAVASIVRTDTGDFTVTFADGYRYAVAVLTSISGATGHHVEWAIPSNEGSGHTTAVTMALTVSDDEGAATDTTGRMVSVVVFFKNSGNGT
jgi:hypothetical protein